MRLFSNKKRKGITIAVNCLLGAAVAACGLLGDAAVAGAAEEIKAKYTNGSSNDNVIIAADKTKALEFYAPDNAPAEADGIYYGTSEYSEYPEYIAGIFSDSEAAENANVFIHGGNFTNGEWIFGGHSEEDKEATSNTVTIFGGTFTEGRIYGGHHDNCLEGQEVANNIVTISDGTFTGEKIVGGYSYNGDATGNKVAISGGTFTGCDIYGGLTDGDGAVSGNTVTISGGTFTGGAIYGGLADGGGRAQGNTLNISVIGVKAERVSDFSNFNFYVPKGAVNGDTMLKAATADITGATIKAGVAEGSGLRKNDKINLLTADTLNGAPASMAADLIGAGLVEIDGTVKVDGNSVVLIMNEGLNKELTEDAKSLVETRAGGMALLNTGADMVIGRGFQSAQTAAEAESAGSASGGFTPYAAIGGANMRYETGSYVDSKGWGANIGFSRIINYQNSRLTLAPFVEYGKASYDSYLNNGTHGSGDSSFTGVGFMAKNEQKDGLYYEGSVRLGRAKGDYQGDASTYGSNYDTASNYLAFHAGIGKLQKLNDKNSIDYYGKFFYTHQNGDTVNIHSTLGDAMYDFDAINSYRLRLGARWSQKLGKRDKLYAGLAWDYEFDSEARAHYNGMSTPAPTMKGSSGMLELGWKQEATKENPFGVDVGVTGWCGKQRGVQFNAGFSWAF